MAQKVKPIAQSWGKNPTVTDDSVWLARTKSAEACHKLNPELVGLFQERGWMVNLRSQSSDPLKKFEVVDYQFDFHLVRMMSTNRRWQVLNSKIRAL